jgi:hypothetical protein
MMSLKSDFQHKLKEIAKSKKQPIEKAFIHWYINVAFGDTNYTVTDGPSDGGIDAIVKPKRVGGNKLVYILQSKYTDSFFRKKAASPLSLTPFIEFDNLHSIFDSDNKFENWIESVDISLKTEYQMLRKDYLNEKNIIEWRLITLHSRSKRGENRLQYLGTDAFLYGPSLLELYELEQEGATPPGDPLELTFAESMTVEDSHMGYKSYVLAADLDNFVDYLDNDPEGKLFARNVRLDLHSDVNKNIKSTYSSSPKEFWYSHNGISVICSNATISGKSIRLINPSVINGSQTLNTLRDMQKNKRHRGARVLTRVLVITGGNRDKGQSLSLNKFVNDIIFRTNQQNKMYAYDLRANDIQQVALARDFMKNGVFYERRRGEWKQRRRAFRNAGVQKLTSVELAQILAAFNPIIGVATAKKGKEILFREKYKDLFYSPFAKIYLAYKSFRFASDVIKEMSYYKTTPRMRKHSLFTVASIYHDIVRKSKHYKQLLASTHSVNSIDIANSRCELLEKIVKAIFKDCWSNWRKENKKDPTLSPNNFFKSERWNS